MKNRLFFGAVLLVSLITCPLSSQVQESQHLYHETDTSEYFLHVFRPEGSSEPLSCLVFFHGWGKVTDPGAFFPQCKYLAERGLVAISAEYRVDRENNFEAVLNALRAMEWVKGNTEQLNIDPERIGVAGGSGGGWTASCLTTVCTEMGLNKVLLGSGIPALSVLFNPLLDTEGRMELKYSPAHHLDSDQAPVLIMIGTEDFLLDQNKAYAQRTRDLGNDCRLVLYEGAKHAFFNYGQYENKFYFETLKEVENFLTEHGFLEPVSD